MNLEGSGCGLQIRRDLKVQWFKSTFRARSTNFVLPVSGKICTTSAKDIIYIIALALVVQAVPLTDNTALVAHMVVASCANIVHNKVQNSDTTSANHL